MVDPAPPPEADPAGAPRLVTIAEAASITGRSRKAIARRIERGTLRHVHDAEGQRMVPRAELDRAGLLAEGSPAGAGTEIVQWQSLYERERDERDDLAERERALREQLVAIANAGPIRAARLRRQARRQLAHAAVPAADDSPPSSAT
jgi:hypothetical protein